MKSILIALFAGTLMLHAENPPSAIDKAELSYRKGIAAEKAGDPSAARTAYTEALKLNPQHANARYRLGELRLKSKDIAEKGRAAQYSDIILPKVELEDVPLADALNYLTALIGEQAKEAKKDAPPGFVVQDPDKKLGEGQVTLKLKNVPAKTALEYILSQAGAKARYDEFAVVILPAK
ncbi:tetratricopeptide repeat protein [Luteolibacter pohnpeiensis]|uniref:Tetratricopeptide repeat protein n=1 Tax=Luteolibacter pohnpeiensis TaxID=454153 RepID=A0A934VUH0_9BACT|nr:tetratricopeptide repeat protein [Luteolibacter pohnpeiensis]MBK1882532.1 tetratricopeptide repeat protein [Luteolibacter pohnpeiensis]